MFPEFNEFIDKFDLIGFQETRTDELDTIDLKDYILHFKHRKGISRHKSGGIALAYKKHLKNYIKPIETQSILVYWFVLSKTLTKTDDILCGIVYIPQNILLMPQKSHFMKLRLKCNQFLITFQT